MKSLLHHGCAPSTYSPTSFSGEDSDGEEVIILRVRYLGLLISLVLQSYVAAVHASVHMTSCRLAWVEGLESHIFCHNLALIFPATEL